MKLFRKDLGNFKYFHSLNEYWGPTTYQTRNALLPGLIELTISCGWSEVHKHKYLTTNCGVTTLGNRTGCQRRYKGIYFKWRFGGSGSLQLLHKVEEWRMRSFLGVVGDVKTFGTKRAASAKGLRRAGAWLIKEPGWGQKELDAEPWGLCLGVWVFCLVEWESIKMV